MKCGRRPSGPTPHLPAFADYAATLGNSARPQSPDYFVDWSRSIEGWTMAMNDKLSCCPISGAVHLIQQWGAYAGAEYIATDVEVVGNYAKALGYDGTPATDHGGTLADTLRSWATNGMAAGGKVHKVLAFARIDPLNDDHVEQAIDKFGSIYLGALLPTRAKTQDDWTGPDALAGDDEPGSWSGHCMIAPSLQKFVTWGALQPFAKPWWRAYVDEAWAVLSSDWIEAGRAPNGDGLAALIQDIGSLGAAP